MCRAFTMAGAECDLVHVDALVADPAQLETYDLLGFPGGFSYGDDIASGRIFAVKLRERLYPALREAVARGCLVIGACNGFQALVQVGLLPGPGEGEDWPEDAPPAQSLSLTDNADARFHDRWVGVTFDAASPCIWTKGLSEVADPQVGRAVNVLPVAHGEGRLAAADDSILDELERRGQVAVRYTDNFNGSARAIAGVCDASGRVLGLMPHPERYLDWNRHPFWTRLEPAVRSGATPGLRMFRNAVEVAALART